jgi:hypothetical protein
MNNSIAWTQNNQHLAETTEPRFAHPSWVTQPQLTALLSTECWEMFPMCEC